MRRLLPGLLTLLILAAAAAPASASSPEIGIADDRVLMPGGETADQAVAEWRELGVDTVRIFALWSRIAPGAESPSWPEGFDASDPNDPRYQWFYLDHAIARVRRAGMSVTLTITGPGPLWSSAKPMRNRPAYRPRASAYAEFAEAVARRYGDDVDRYLLWNEPNLPAFLYPQARCRRGECTPVAPHLYRDLVRAAYPVLHEADPDAQVVIGVTSPRGQRLRSAKSVMRPLLFLRQLGCRSDRWRRIRSDACRRFKPARGDGYAIHPYSGRIPPERAHRNRDDVSLASIPTLTRTLDRLRRLGGLRSKRKMGIFVDEYGYQTNPPDRTLGIPRGRQDRWLQRAGYIAWRTPRLRLFTQYLWRDEPLGRHNSGWQSGLRYTSGRAKPSVRHFDTPFVVDAARSRLWGQVRPGGRHRVTIERRARGSKRWRRVARVRTNRRGYWALKRRLVKGSSYRYRVAGLTSASHRR
jgi:hypothetical protein